MYEHGEKQTSDEELARGADHLRRRRRPPRAHPRGREARRHAGRADERLRRRPARGDRLLPRVGSSRAPLSRAARSAGIAKMVTHANPARHPDVARGVRPGPRELPRAGSRRARSRSATRSRSSRSTTAAARGPSTRSSACDAVSAARRFRPDVVFAHFLFPAGAAGAMAAIAGRAPLVVMAHGQDVANLGSIPGVVAATRWVLGRSAGVICNSRWLADRLCERFPAARAKIEIADCGIDLDAFVPRRSGRGARRPRLGRRGPRLRLRRLADRAQERRPPRRRLRAARARPPRIRRRRAAAPRARGPRRRHASSAGSRRPRCRAGSPPPTSSASPR